MSYVLPAALLERVREFRLVISGRWEEASQLRFRLNGLEDRLADLRNQSSTARDKALRALELISNNRVQIVNERIGDVNVSYRSCGVMELWRQLALVSSDARSCIAE